MSVLITGIEMPKEGTFSIIYIYSDGHISMPAWGKGVDVVQDAQAISVPLHGRLGDLDKLERGLRQMAKYQNGDRQQGILGCCETIRLAPTIIPASKGNEE